MNFSEIFPYVFSLLVGVCSWRGTYMTLSKKVQQDIDILKESNKHEIEKLMNQHKLARIIHGTVLLIFSTCP